MRVEPIKELKKILTTLAMLSIIFCALIMPAQSEQSDVESPNANFFAFSTSGDAPFEAAFMDTSTGNPTEWYWEFGDGATSTKQDPDHTYSEPGSYTVILTATNDAGSDITTKAGYIKVKGFTTNTESTEDVDFTTDTDSTTYIESTKEEDSTNDIEPTVDTVEKPVAKFSATPKSGIEPLTIEFTDKSTENPTEWYWEFGDGETSTQQDPDHTYSEPGSYTVKLTVTNDAGSDEKTKAGYIKVEESTKDTEKPVAGFDAYVTSGTAPFHVVFLDESKGEPTSWDWDFGDGDTSTQRDPEHTYSEPGSYTVKLTATNDAGSDEKTKYDYITVEGPTTNTESKTDVEPTKDMKSTANTAEKPVAKFSATPKSGIEPLTVEFTDKSTRDPTDWYWDFGDGSTSDSENPVHEYSQAGIYTITLTATNDAGSDEKTKYDYITVEDSTTDTEPVDTAEKPVAKFSATPRSGDIPLTVEFTDKSTENPTEWYWEFGDGETSTQQDPDHTYSEPGSYTVILTATNDAGTDLTTKAGYINVKESTKDTEKPVAGFDAYVTSGTAPFHVVFLDESKGEPTSWDWDFGDGDTSTQRDPEHTYSELGSYTVKLTATNDAGSDEKTKTDYIIVTKPTTNTESKTDAEPTKDKESTTNTAEKPVAKFFATPKSGNTPLTVEFTDTSTENPTEWYWDFGDGSTSDSENPVHEYSQAGTYTITLTTTNDAGSDKVIKTGYIKVKESTKDTKVSANKSVSLSYLKVAAETDPLRPQGETTPEAVDSVKIVEAALAEEGLLSDKYAYDGSYGTETIKAYKKWQESIGSAERYCDGIPGEKDLTKLGNKYGFTVDTSTVFESNADINLNTPDYKQPTQNTTQEQPQIYRIDPNSGRAECVSHEDAQSQLHLSDQQFNSELRKGEVLILRNGRLSISTQETIGQINDPSRATPLMAFAIRRLQQDATTFHGAFPSYYYETFSRAVIMESIRLNGADAGIEAVGKAFGSKDFSQGLAALHLYEALARRDDNTGFDKVQHFTASAVSEFENTKIGTDIRQYGKEIFRDEIPSWFKDTDDYDPNDMLANNRGQAFGAELYQRYHPIRANPIDAAKRQINEFKRGLTSESSTMNTEEKPVAKSETSASKSVSLSYIQLAATSDPTRPQGGTTPGATYSVKIVEAALAEEGLLSDKYAYDGSYGTATIKAYKKWQESIGSAERYCDGIPGEKDLTKLGNKYEFTVDTSLIIEENKETSKSKSTYDRKAAVEYAHKYVEPLYSTQGIRIDNPAAYNNKTYYPFEADCTNYVSQCLYAGGWKQIVKDDSRSSEAWYYEKYVPGEHWWNHDIEKFSHTWTVADDFYKFCSTHPDRAMKVSLGENNNGLDVGDIVQMDGIGKNGKPDGEWDHSMIISKKSSGKLYFSAHTADLKDEPLSAIQERNPNAKYIGWHII